jgi:hypothetical protein
MLITSCNIALGLHASINNQRHNFLGLSKKKMHNFLYQSKGTVYGLNRGNLGEHQFFIKNRHQ